MGKANITFIMIAAGLMALGLFVLAPNELNLSDLAINNQTKPAAEIEDPVRPTDAEGMILIADVPFTAQAPDGNWSNMMFQYGCEEASVLMAIHWAESKPLTTDLAKAEIENISQFEEVNYGDYYDRSAIDTTELIKDYFGYHNIEYRSGINASDIIEELKQGHLVITPMDGQALGNPYYTAPGPEKHMLVVIGYDPVSEEFITNDPGTRQGEGFRYDHDTFEAALRDFPTGKDLPITRLEKNMVVVKKD